MSPTEAALAIGAKCGGSAPSNDDAQLMRILRYLTPRVEGALNVQTISREAGEDRFYLSSMPSSVERPMTQMLLTNGFIVPGTVVITPPLGDVISGAEADELTDHLYGTVTLESWSRGMYKVAYQSGYEVPANPDPLPAGFDANDKVLMNVPDFIKGIVSAVLVVYYRSGTLVSRASKEISFGQVAKQLEREIYARVYEKYQRPRVGMVFSERYSNGI